MDNNNYVIQNNIIKVNRLKGIRIKDYNESKYTDYIWNKGYIHLSDIGKLKEYKIYITYHNNLDIIIRPREKYKDALFEQLFGFKSLCSNYDTTKIIGIY